MLIQPYAHLVKNQCCYVDPPIQEYIKQGC